MKNVSKECINPQRRFRMIDDVIQIRLLPGEDLKEVAKAFIEFYHAAVEVYDEHGMHCIAVIELG